MTSTVSPNIPGVEILDPTTGLPYTTSAVPTNTRLLTTADTVTAVLQNTTSGVDGSVNPGDAAAPGYLFNGDTGIGRYDRTRSDLALLMNAGTISSGGGTGTNNVTLTGNPAGLVAGMPVWLFGGASTERLYVQSVVGAVVTFTSNIQVASHTQLKWDAFNPLGPQLSLFLPDGIQVNALAAYGSAVGPPYMQLLRSADADAMAGGNLLGVAATLYNGATSDRQRGPTIFKSLVAAATAAVIWTPAAGKKFRVLGWALSVATTAATALTLTDTSTTPNGPWTLPGAVVGTPIVSPPLGNGFISGAANNTLVLTFAGGGTVSGLVFGTEE